MAQELKSKLKLNINDTLMHCPDVAINNKVFYHRWLFAEPVKPFLCTTGPMEPLGSSNQNW